MCRLFFLILFSSSGFSMEINQVPKDFGALSTSELNALQNNLLLQLNMYWLYLTKSLGCDCCKGLKELFNTDHHKHVIERQKQLIKISNMMKKPMWMPHEVIAYISKNMAPFNSPFGQLFETNCKREVAKFTQANPQEILESRHGCVICLEQDATVIVQPCGHKAYCASCDNSMSLVLKSRCSICNQGRESTLVIQLKNTRNLCLNCGDKKANVFNNCGHLVVCSDCIKTKALGECPLCDEKIGNIQEVISSSPPCFPEWVDARQN